MKKHGISILSLLLMLTLLLGVFASCGGNEETTTQSQSKDETTENMTQVDTESESVTKDSASETDEVTSPSEEETKAETNLAT